MIIVVSPDYELRNHFGERQALERSVRRSMGVKGGSVTSASGMSAMLAINYCERLGISYTVTARAVVPGGRHAYHVKRED